MTPGARAAALLRFAPSVPTASSPRRAVREGDVGRPRGHAGSRRRESVIGIRTRGTNIDRAARHVNRSFAVALGRLHVCLRQFQVAPALARDRNSPTIRRVTEPCSLTSSTYSTAPCLTDEIVNLNPSGSRNRNARAPQMSAGSDSRMPPRSFIRFAISSTLCGVVS